MGLAHWSFYALCQRASKTLLALLQHRHTHTLTHTHHADQSGPVLICVCMFNIYNPPSLVQSHTGSSAHACVHTQPQTCTCTPDPSRVCVCQVGRQAASKKGGCDWGEGSSAGVSQLKPHTNRTHAHTQKLTQRPLRLTGLISSTRPPTLATAEGRRSQAGLQEC